MEKTHNDLNEEIPELTELEFLGLSKDSEIEEFIPIGKNKKIMLNERKRIKEENEFVLAMALTVILVAFYILAIISYKPLFSKNDFVSAFAFSFFVAFVMPVLTYKFFIFLIDKLEAKITRIIFMNYPIRNTIYCSFFAACLAIIGLCILITK